MKAAVFDIETTGFDAIGSGSLLCMVIKPLTGRSETIRADDLHCAPGSDKRLVQTVNECIGRYDLVIGHNIEKFDLPWLRSRAVFWGLPEIARPFVYDTCKAFRRMGYKTIDNGYGKPTACLGHVVDFFGEVQEKTPIYPREWWAAVWKSSIERRAAMDKIVCHCYADVRMSEKIYYLLLKVDHSAIIRRFR